MKIDPNFSRPRGSPYVPYEDAIIKHFYPDLLAIENALHWRGPRGVHKRRRQLGLKSRVLHRRPVVWKGSEIKIVREHWATATCQQLKKMLPRHNWNAIKTQASRLKIKRPQHVARAFAYETKSRLLRQFIDIMKQEDLSFGNLGDQCFVHRGAFYLWRKKGISIRVAEFQKMLDYMGYTLAIVKKK